MLQSINKFLFFFSLSLLLSSTCGYNNPRFLTPAYSHLLLFLASTHRLSLLLSTSLTLLSRFISILSRTFLFPLAVARYTRPFFLSTHIPGLSFSPFLLFTFIPTSLRPLLSFSHATLFRSRAFFFVHLSLLLHAPPPSSLSFSVPFSHTSHSLLRVSCSLTLVFPIPSLSRSLFIPRGRILLSASPALSFYSPYHSFWRRTSLSSRSIELRSSGSFYLARSSYFLLFLLFFFCAFSLLRLPLLSLYLLLFSPFVSLSPLIPRVSPGAVRLVLSLSLYVRHSLSPSCLHAGGGHKSSLSYVERWCETHRTPLDKFA